LEERRVDRYKNGKVYLGSKKIGKGHQKGQFKENNRSGKKGTKSQKGVKVMIEKKE